MQRSNPSILLNRRSERRGFWPGSRRRAQPYAGTASTYDAEPGQKTELGTSRQEKRGTVQLISDDLDTRTAQRPASRGVRDLCGAALLTWAVSLGASALSVGFVAGVAHAQSTPQQLAEANKRAMEDYNNLDMEKSKASLEKAAKNAEKNGIRGPALARTYSNLAVVLISGMGDQKGAVTAFSRALKEDPKVEPDPIVATPEVMTAYAQAKANNAKGVPVADPEEEAPVEKVVQGPVEGNLDHTPAAEQLAQTAVPVFVRKSDDLDIQNVKIFFRSLGMKKPKSQALTETDEGWTFLIPCTDVYEPKVEYFIVASDGDGNPVGNAGTSENPIVVPIVGERTQEAPSLPGSAPPSQCSSSDDECPPGAPGCGGSAGMGDTCSSDNECQAGLVCDDDVCVTGEREGGDEDEDQEEESGGRQRVGKRFFFGADIGVGLVHVGKGKTADRKVNNAFSAVQKTGNNLTNDDGTANPKGYSDGLVARGYDCNVKQTPDMSNVVVDQCKVAVSKAGFVAMPVLNVAVGYHFTPAFALALTGRFQIGRGEGPLAGMLLGARGEYTLTKPFEEGILFTALASVSVGQLQARPPAKGSIQGPYATNASIGGIGMAVNLGAKAGYRVNKNFAINVTPMLNFALPHYLFGLDLLGGAEVNF